MVFLSSIFVLCDNKAQTRRNRSVSIEGEGQSPSGNVEGSAERDVLQPSIEAGFFSFGNNKSRCVP